MAEPTAGKSQQEQDPESTTKSGRKAFQRGRTSPSHTLEDAIDGIVRVYRALGTTSHSREDAAQAMGYKAGSGAANSRVGSLTHFTLLDRQGASYAVTELARRIIEHTDDRDRELAIAEAATAPSLYCELVDRFDGQPLPPMLPNILARDYGVVPKNTQEVAARFEETLRFAGLLRDGKVWAKVEEDDQAVTSGHAKVSDTEQTKTSEIAEKSSVSAAAPSVPSNGGYRVPLTKKREAVLFLPRPVEISDLRRIKSWIDLMEDVLTESEGEPAQEKPEAD